MSVTDLEHERPHFRFLDLGHIIARDIKWRCMGVNETTICKFFQWFREEFHR